MEPVTIPDSVEWAGAEKVKAKGDGGAVQDVEAMVGLTANGQVPFFAMLVRLDLADIEHLQRDPHFWLLQYGRQIQPFSFMVGLEPDADLEPGEKRAALRFTESELRDLADILGPLVEDDLQRSPQRSQAHAKVQQALERIDEAEAEKRRAILQGSRGKLHSVTPNGHRGRSRRRPH